MQTLAMDDLVRRARAITYLTDTEFTADLAMYGLAGRAGVGILNVIYIEANADLPQAWPDSGPEMARERNANAERLRSALADDLADLVAAARACR